MTGHTVFLRFKPLYRRILAIIVTLTAALIVGLHSLANSLGEGREESASELAPWDGSLMARYARRLITSDPDEGQLAGAETLALRALKREGPSVDAVVTLGIVEQIRGNDRAARAYFGFAEKLSRQDMLVHLWGIEDAVRRNDIPGALMRYDIALRRAPSAKDMLFPILAAAISDIEIRMALVKLFAERPPWAESFMVFLAKEGPDSQATADLMVRLQKIKVTVSKTAKAVLTDTLIAKGAIGQAWSFYAASHSGANRRHSRDPWFNDHIENRTSFDWQLFGDSGTSILIERRTEGNTLAFSVSPGNGGLMARQMQTLLPGRYVLHGKSSRVVESELPQPFWELRCVDGRLLGQIELPKSSKGNGEFGGQFGVPADCPAQYLSLIARPYITGNNIEGYVYQALLKPAP